MVHVAIQSVSNNLPTTMNVRAPLMVALNFMTINELIAVFASKIETMYFAAPRLMFILPRD